MLKSWKMRGLVAVGAVALVAPFTFTSGALAAAGTATVGSVNAASGNVTPGATLNVTGSGCGPTAVGTVAQTATIRLRGPGGTTSAPVVGTASATVNGDGSFQGTLTVPSDARVGDQFVVGAFCSQSGVQGTEAFSGPFAVQAGSVLSGAVTGTLAGSGSTSVTGTGLTSTSGSTTATSGTTSDLSGTTGTTGVAVPITQTPTFTG